MAVTETIQEILQGIDDSQYGRDMRQYIHKGIQKCYEEGSAGETDLVARERLDEVEATLTSSLTEMQETLDEGLANGFANIAPTESTTTASQAYAVGDYLMYNNKLYKVTTAIISGGTIEVGTNVVESTVAESMKKSNASGVLNTQQFRPSTSSTGTKNGTKIYLSKGTYLVQIRSSLSSTSTAEVDSLAMFKTGDMSEDILCGDTLNSSGGMSGFAQLMDIQIVEATSDNSYVYPRAVLRTGTNYSQYSINLFVVKIG